MRTPVVSCVERVGMVVHFYIHALCPGFNQHERADREGRHYTLTIVSHENSKYDACSSNQHEMD